MYSAIAGADRPLVVVMETWGASHAALERMTSTPADVDWIHLRWGGNCCSGAHVAKQHLSLLVQLQRVIDLAGASPLGDDHRPAGGCVSNPPELDWPE